MILDLQQLDSGRLSVFDRDPVERTFKIVRNQSAQFKIGFTSHWRGLEPGKPKSFINRLLEITVAGIGLYPDPHLNHGFYLARPTEFTRVPTPS